MAGPSIPAGDRHRGQLFGASAEEYDRIRPGYPAPTVDAVADAAGPRVLDVGSGTGKFGAALAARGHEVTALDPDPALLALNPLPSVLGRAEELPFADASFDAVTIAQAWHWLDARAAAGECARVLRGGGVLAIVLNQLDVRIDWVLRLSRIMHAGDVYRPHWQPELGPHFDAPAVRLDEFSVEMTVEDVVALAATRTYWLRSSEAVRARVEANLRDFLTREHPVEEPFALPYLCLSRIAVRAG